MINDKTLSLFLKIYIVMICLSIQIVTAFVNFEMLM